jgi:hypothetical protein
MGGKRLLRRLSLFNISMMPLLVGTLWAGEAITQRPYGWRWRIDPTSLPSSQPSLLGSTGHFGLPTPASLQQGNYSLGRFGAFGKVLSTALATDGDRLRLHRSTSILSGAYGFRQPHGGRACPEPARGVQGADPLDRRLYM